MKRFLTIAATTALFVSSIVACSSDTDDSAGDTASTTGADTASTDTGPEDTGAVTDTGTTPDTGKPIESDVIIAAPDTGANEDAGPAAPPETCREAILCHLACEDDDCRTACRTDAPATIITSMEAIDTCLANSCAGNIPLQCLVDKAQCYTEFHACFMEGNSGVLSCEDAVECYNDCGVTDKEDVFIDFAEKPKNAACEDPCLQSADEDAQIDLLNWAFCVADFCKLNPSDECQKQSGPTCGNSATQCTDK